MSPPNERGPGSDPDLNSTLSSTADQSDQHADRTAFALVDDPELGGVWLAETGSRGVEYPLAWLWLCEFDAEFALHEASVFAAAAARMLEVSDDDEAASTLALLRRVEHWIRAATWALETVA